METIARAIYDAIRHGYRVPAEKVGEGATRTVYRVEDKVFKFNLEPYPFGENSNVDEFKNWKRILELDLPDNVCMPTFELLTLTQDGLTVDVIVSDFIDGEPATGMDHYEFMRDVITPLVKLDDLFHSNVFFKDDKYWMIDLGC